jgi:tetratricopeptide (TPR) repeat protein
VLSARDLTTAARRYEEARSHRQKLANLRPPRLLETYQIAYTSFEASGSKGEVEQFFSRMTDTQARSTEAVELKRHWAFVTGDLEEYAQLAQITPPPRSMDLALVLSAQGDLPAARAGLSDINTLKSTLEKEPANPWIWSELAEREAFLGHRDEALRYARRAIELQPESLDAWRGPRRSASLAFVHAWTGDKERAIAEYARLLRVPWSGLNVHEMERHPAYAPLRGDGRFEALLTDPRNNAPLF